MAKLKSKTSILEIGKKICDELELNDTSNILSKWMAYRISELMSLVREEKKGAKKEKLKRECEELIVRVWRLKHNLAYDDPILKISKKLNTIASIISSNLQIKPNGSSKSFTKSPKSKTFEANMKWFYDASDLERLLSTAGILNSLPNKLSKVIGDIKDDNEDQNKLEELINLRDLVLGEIEAGFPSLKLNKKSSKSRKKAIIHSLEKIQQEKAKLIRNLAT